MPTEEDYRKQATPESILKRLLRGDPVHYDETFHCALLVKIFSDGQHVAAFCAWCGMAASTFYEWLQRYPTFAHAYEIAKAVNKQWFEAKALNGLDDPSFNNTLWSMLMRNKHDYTEHRKVKVKSLDKAKNFNEQIKCISKGIANGEYTSNEINQLAGFVAASARIDETTELRKEVEELKELNGTA